MKPLDVRHFFESLGEQDLITFLAVLQQNRRSQIEPIVAHNQRPERFILFMHVFFDSGTRYLSVEIDIWWNRDRDRFDSTVRAITEYGDEHQLELMRNCEKILYEGVREHS